MAVSHRLMITGGAGMLAGDLRRYLSSETDMEILSLPRTELDITKPSSISAAFNSFKPEAVINPAAILVDASEADPASAFRVNAWGARNLALACNRVGAVLVHVSTCGLFGDEVRPYHEYDHVVLKTVYARSKYAGEGFVRGLCERHFILRPGWLYGGDLDYPKNFVGARFHDALKNPVLYGVTDKHGSPTYTEDIAAAIPGLLSTGEYGLYHIASQGGCTRAEYMRCFLREFGLETRVVDVDSTHFPRKADTPNCEMLVSLNLEYAGLHPLPPWREALCRYVRRVRDHASQHGLSPKIP